MELNRVTIKEQAKQIIKGRVFILFLIIFVSTILTNGISFITSGTNNLPQLFSEGLDNFNPEAFQSSSTTSVNFLGVFTFVFAPLFVALAGLFLNIIKGAQYDIGGEFTYVFKNTFDSNYVQKFLLKLLVGIFTFLWSILFIIPGIVYYYKMYFTDFIMADNPELTWRETIELSKKMTYGHKGELFMLDLSFFAWYCLMGITFGLAGIYVMPYIYTTKALYYENFKARGLQTGELKDADFMSQTEKAAQAYGFGTNQTYQPPVQPQYQPPQEQVYQPPVQPQYQPPQEQVYQPPETPAQESFYTPPADTQQYFTPENTDETNNE